MALLTDAMEHHTPEHVPNDITARTLCWLKTLQRPFQRQDTTIQRFIHRQHPCLAINHQPFLQHHRNNTLYSFSLPFILTKDDTRRAGRFLISVEKEEDNILHRDIAKRISTIMVSDVLRFL